MTYKYADAYNNNTPCDNIYSDSCFPINSRSSALLECLLKIAISFIENSCLKSSYPFFNWDKLDSVKIFKCDVIINTSTGKINSSFAGCYISSYNQIFISSSAIESRSEFTLICNIVHELCHLLFYSSFTLDNHFLAEGIVEFLASVVMEDNDYDYSFSKRYHYPLFLALRFMLISSDNDFFELVFYGKFYDWLDNLTKPGCAKKLQYCLHLCSLGSNLNDLLMVIEDIVAHAVRCFLDNIDSKNKRQKVIFSYRAIVVDELLIYEFDFNYLSDVLNFEL